MITEGRMKFADWWNEIGSGITPAVGDDHEEHARKVAEIAWDAAVVTCARAAEGFTDERDDRKWAPGSLYDTLRRETAAAIMEVCS